MFENAVLFGCLDYQKLILDVIQLGGLYFVEVFSFTNVIIMLKDNLFQVSTNLTTYMCIAEVNVPVVGGHAGITILPLFSQVLFLPLPSNSMRTLLPMCG